MTRACLQWMATFAALIAAGFWLASALVPIPKIDLNFQENAPMFLGALRLVSTLNAFAAGFATLSALFQAIAYTKNSS